MAERVAGSCRLRIMSADSDAGAAGAGAGAPSPHTVVVQPEALSVDAANVAVADDGSGGVSIFIGTTRDSFKGTRASRLPACNSTCHPPCCGVAAASHEPPRSTSSRHHPMSVAEPAQYIPCAIHPRLPRVGPNVGKEVTQLEYECFVPMAKKEMLKICETVSTFHTDVL